VDVANGQTVTNLAITDALPNSLQFVSVDSVTGNGTTLVLPISTPSTTVPGGTLTRRLDSVTGTTSTSDAVMTFSFYVPLTPAPPAAGEILDPSTGLPQTATDDAKATGTWNPIDPRDPTTTVNSDLTPVDHTLTLRSLATQKTVALVNDTGAPGYTPGDTVEYTLQVQVSDYFAFDNVILTDLLGDGLAVDPSFTPTLSVSEHGVTTAGIFTPPNFSDAAGTPDDTLTFRVSDQLVALGQDGNLLGGNIPDGGVGAGNVPQSAPPLFSPGTTATIQFRAIIHDTYKQNQASGVDTVAPNDTIPNDLTVAGDVLNREDLSPLPGNPTVTDTSSADVTTVAQTAVKSVYAVNGNTAIGDPITIAAGDTVTYRLVVTLPTTSATDFRVTDFLPVPLFDATELTTLSLTTPSAAPPPAGTVTLGPTDTFYAVYSAIAGPVQIGAVDAASNSASIDFGSFNDPNNTPTTLDILFTVTATAKPKSDQLLLTNQILSQEQNRENQTSTDNTIVQVITSEPNIPDNAIQKGVVATDNPKGVFSPAVVGPVSFSPPGTPGTRFTGILTTSNLLATPIDSNLSGVDAGDLVTFAVVTANVGTGPNGAFDVEIRDTLPAGFEIPTSGLGLNMTVTDGTGALMPFTNLGTGASAGLFGTGIELTDPGPTPIPAGALDPGKDLQGNPIENGRNIVIITYDLEVVGTITPNTTITNTASLFNYASTEGGPNFSFVPLTNTASVVTATPTMTKQLVGTEIVNANNAANQAVIGELVTYELTVTLPEGVTPGLTVQDTLDDGLAFVRIDSVTASADIVGEDFVKSVTNSGRTLTATFGRVINKNRDNSQAETIIVRYTAVVLNQASNQSGTQLKNNVRLTYTGGAPVTASAPPVTVIEPTIDVSKQARVDGAGTVGEAGSSVEYTIVVQNTGAVDAFDLTLSDPLPTAASGVTLIANPVLTSVVDTDGPVDSTDFEIVGSAATGYTLRTKPGVTFDFPVDPGRSITLRVTGTLTGAVQPAELIQNTATVRWTSLNGNPGRRSAFNPNSTERTGSGNGPNDYIDSGSADISIFGSIMKTLVSTSDSFTQGSNVAVGEIARYRLTGVMAQGNLPAVVAIDQLPTGMQFLNDGTTKIAFVSNGAGFAVNPAVFPPGSDAFVTGNQSTVVTPTFVLPASQISVAAGSGGDVSFNLGDVVNNDRDADSELVIIDFNALVLNEAGNQAGTTLNNDFEITSNGALVGNPSAPVSVHVVEPKLTIDKQVTPTSGEAGDLFTFTVTVKNATGATVSPAHDVRVLDPLPTPEYALVPGSVQVTPGVGVVDNSTGNTVDVTIPLLIPGATATVTYTAHLMTSISPNQTVVNQATTTYTSLPGPNGDSANPTGSVTPGASGNPNGERNGMGGVNKYFASDTAAVTVPDLSLTKVVANTSFAVTGSGEHDPGVTDLAIGEVVTFDVTFTLPALTTTAFLVDDLPDLNGRLEALSGRVLSIGANISGSALNVGDPAIISDRNGDGINDRASFNFGTLVDTPNGGVGSNDQVVVEITARVPDVPDDVDGVQMINTATLSYTNGILTATAPVEIVEPKLGITKDITNTTTVSAGGVVDYESHIDHTAASTEDAVNVVIEDLLSNPLLTLVPGSVVVTPSAGATIVDLNPDGFQVSIADIPLGEDVTIRYQATVGAAANPGQILPNTIAVDYNGTPPDPTVRPQEADATANLVVDGASVSGFVLQEERPGPSLPIPGTTVTLVGVDIGGQPVVRTTTTDPTGFYSFSNLTPGTYTIIETQPNGFISSRQQPGSPYGQPSPVENRLIVVIPAGAVDPGLDFDFFEVQPSTLGGFVYEDVANNKVRDPLVDPGIPDVTVTLMGTDWNGAAVTQRVQTSASGAYTFTNLLPGDYTIVETQPAGYLDDAETIGSLGGTSIINDQFTIPNVGQGVAGVGYNFGELRPSSLSGFVYIDRNNNGRKDRGEPGIGGVRIQLTGTDDLGNAVTVEVRTDSHGAYSFLNLRPGTYMIHEFQPAAFLDGKDALGSLGGVQTNDRFDQIIVGPNVAGTDYLFGELSPPPVPDPSKRGLLFG
jgi:large repetitive protein